MMRKENIVKFFFLLLWQICGRRTTCTTSGRTTKWTSRQTEPIPPYYDNKKSLLLFHHTAHSTGFCSHFQELFYKHTSRVLSRHRTLMGADSPFFLFLSLQSVHTPLECLGRHKKAFRWIREHKRMIMLCA